MSLWLGTPLLRRTWTEVHRSNFKYLDMNRGSGRIVSYQKDNRRRKKALDPLQTGFGRCRVHLVKRTQVRPREKMSSLLHRPERSQALIALTGTCAVSLWGLFGDSNPEQAHIKPSYPTSTRKANPEVGQ